MQNLLKCHVLNWRTRRKLKNNSIDKLQHGCELRSYEYHMFLKANLQKIGKILFAIFSIINSFKRFVTVAQVVVSISLRIKICVITDDELLSKIMCRCVSEFFFFLWKGIDCQNAQISAAHYPIINQLDRCTSRLSLGNFIVFCFKQPDVVAYLPENLIVSFNVKFATRSFHKTNFSA